MCVKVYSCAHTVGTRTQRRCISGINSQRNMHMRGRVRSLLGAPCWAVYARVSQSLYLLISQLPLRAIPAHLHRVEYEQSTAARMPPSEGESLIAQPCTFEYGFPGRSATDGLTTRKPTQPSDKLILTTNSLSRSRHALTLYSMTCAPPSLFNEITFLSYQNNRTLYSPSSPSW